MKRSLPRRRPWAPYAAVGAAAALRIAQVPAAWIGLQCLQRRLGALCRAAWQGGRFLSGPSFGLRTAFLRTFPGGSVGCGYRHPLERLDAGAGGGVLPEVGRGGRAYYSV